MRRRISIGLLSILVMTMTVCGCGNEMPKLTMEENEMVSQYAASLLLKYDSENHSRLVDTSEFLTSYEAALLAREESIRKYEEEKNAIVNKESVEDTIATELEKDKPAVSESPVSEEPSIQDLASFLNADGFTVEYSGYDMLKKYPEDAAGSVSAEKGKKLLVLYFNVKSLNGGTFDTSNEMPSFYLSVNNGSYFTYNPSTLDDDLSMYFGEFKAGESKRMVVLFEIKDETDISTMKLKIESIFSGEMTMVLK